MILPSCTQLPTWRRRFIAHEGIVCVPDYQSTEWRNGCNFAKTAAEIACKNHFTSLTSNFAAAANHSNASMTTNQLEGGARLDGNARGAALRGIIRACARRWFEPMARLQQAPKHMNIHSCTTLWRDVGLALRCSGLSTAACETRANVSLIFCFLSKQPPHSTQIGLARVEGKVRCPPSSTVHTSSCLPAPLGRSNQTTTCVEARQ